MEPIGEARPQREGVRISMIIKAVKFVEKGFYSQDFAFGGNSFAITRPCTAEHILLWAMKTLRQNG